MTVQTQTRALHIQDINYYILDILGPNKDMITYLNLNKSHKQLQTIPSVVRDAKYAKLLYKIYTQLQEKLENTTDKSGLERDNSVFYRAFINKDEVKFLAKNIIYAKKLFFEHFNHLEAELEIKADEGKMYYVVDCDEVDNIISFLHMNLQHFPNLTYFKWIDRYNFYLHFGYMLHCTFPNTIKTIETSVHFSQLSRSIRLLKELNLSFVLGSLIEGYEPNYQKFYEFFMLDDDKVYDNIISINFINSPIMKYIDKYEENEELKSKILYKFPNLK